MELMKILRWTTLYICFIVERRFCTKKRLHILGIEETINAINNGASIARFGDGEMNIIKGGDIGFQQSDSILADELQYILNSESSTDKCLICIPDALITLKGLTYDSCRFWVPYIIKNRQYWEENLNNKYTYGTTNVSRLYMRYRDKKLAGRNFALLKEIWKDRNIVIIEGEKTRLGVGNDLLSSCASIRRILCPSENAFAKKQEILTYVNDNISKNNLILLALGPTATVLAYYLSESGFQALDIGHCDIEYEWYLRGASIKSKIKNKYTNEAVGGNEVLEICDKNYLNSILTMIS